MLPSRADGLCPGRQGHPATLWSGEMAVVEAPLGWVTGYPLRCCSPSPLVFTLFAAKDLKPKHGPEAEVRHQFGDILVNFG